LTVRHIARLVALMLAILALIHGYWATAGRESLRTVLSSAEVPIPPPWAVWLVAGLLVVGALLVLGRAGDWGVSYRRGCLLWGAGRWSSAFRWPL